LLAPKRHEHEAERFHWVSGRIHQKIVNPASQVCRRCRSLPQSTVAVEPVDGKLSILADLDDVAVWIAHVAAPFPAVRIDPWLGNKERAFGAPLFVAGPDVGDTQIQEAAHP